LPPRKPRVDSLPECWSRFEEPLASELAISFAKRLPAWQANRNLVISHCPIADISRRARKSGVIRVADKLCVFRIALSQHQPAFVNLAKE